MLHGKKSSRNFGIGKLKSVATKSTPYKDSFASDEDEEALRASSPPSSSLSPRQEWWIIFAVRFLAYAIPLSFLLYVLYYNYLPFGYDKTFVINVGEPGDTDSSREFYLEPSRDLSDATSTVAPDGATSTSRTLNGLAYAVFRPKAVLDGADVTVSVEGDGVSIIPPVIDFDPASTTWDYTWDFTKGIPSDLTGNAFMFDGAATFNGQDTRLELASSSDMFEDGPFTVYAEWTPKDSENNFQQIVGHYNWELLQNNNSVSFRIGRMNNATGTTYTISYPVELSFFNKKHTAIATYSPSLEEGVAGYINLYIDNHYISSKNIGNDKIWNSYNNQNLTMGKSFHGIANYFLGNVYKINFSNSEINFYSKIINIPSEKITGENLISIKKTGTGFLKELKLDMVKK
jgi:hypothetical protein